MNAVRMSLLLLVLVIPLLASRASAQVTCETPIFLYDTDANLVRNAGASCHADTSAAEYDLEGLGEGSLKVRSAASFPVTFWCPIIRRNTTYYSTMRNDPDATDTKKRGQKVNVQSLSVRASNQGTSSLSCFAFGSDLVTQSTYFGATRHLCASSSTGCSTAPNPVYSGTNFLNLAWPSQFPAALTVNFGYKCVVPPRSSIVYSQASVIPNP